MPTSRLAKLKCFKRDTFDRILFKTNTLERLLVSKDYWISEILSKIFSSTKFDEMIFHEIKNSMKFLSIYQLINKHLRL